jgi:hypothetical protein
MVLKKYFLFIRCQNVISFPQVNSDSKSVFACFRFFFIKINNFQGYCHSKYCFHWKSTHPTVYTLLLKFYVGDIIDNAERIFIIFPLIIYYVNQSQYLREVFFASLFLFLFPLLVPPYTVNFVRKMFGQMPAAWGTHFFSE